MKKALFFLLLALHALAAQARTYNQGELDALLAPVALYPDPLLTHVLNASAFPQDVAAAAEWRRQNPQVGADDALRAVEGQMWHPSVKALVAQPDVLQRLAESPQWLGALGEAYLGQPQEVQATVQQLRLRAQSNGSLKSDEYQTVSQQEQTIYVQPVYPGVVYAPYYNPYIVYGGWWWPAYRPVFFRPWVPCAYPVTHFVPVVPLRPVLPMRPIGPQPVQAVRRALPQQVSPIRSQIRAGTANVTPQFVQRQQLAQRMPPPAIRATPNRAAPAVRSAPVMQSQNFYRGNVGNAGGYRGASFRGGGGRTRS